MKSKIFLLVVVTIFSFSMNAQKKVIEGVDFPSDMTINNSKVEINGGGLREKYGFMDLYVGALYLKSRSKDGNGIIMTDEEMGIRIVIVSSMVTRERFIEALIEGFENTTAGKSTQSQIDQLEEIYSDPFVEGDEILLNYNPDEGVHFYKNGQKRGTIEGLPFKQALFGIWIGGEPCDDSLKDDMLGLD